MLHVVPALTNNSLQIRAAQHSAPESTDYHGSPLTARKIACCTQSSPTWMIAFADVLHSIPYRSQRTTITLGKKIRATLPSGEAALLLVVEKIL